jgi:large subunit ribosomal protein L6|tara:strand:+ start:65 stop:619 length:555 start_codon:yes stop_codon:yes gene_type:complete
MSRIGNNPIELPQGVTVTLGDNNSVLVKGKLGELSKTFHADLTMKIEENTIAVARPSDSKEHKSFHGLTRSLLNNMIIGVNEGYKKELELVGVGYRASNSGQKLELALGFSHNVIFEIPSEVKVVTLSEKGKNPIITLTSMDNQLLGAVAAKIRSLRKPEPYKGKGIKYVGEQLRRKAGKTAAK